MEENKKNIFRQKSMDAIESPEVLNQYLRVTSPSVWVIFAAVIVVLAGAFVWAIFGRIESRTSVAVVINETQQDALIPQEALQTAVNEHKMMIDGQEITLDPASIEPVVVTEDWDAYVMLAGHLTAGTIVYPIPVATSLNEGIYTGTIVTESLSPISFLLN